MSTFKFKHGKKLFIEPSTEGNLSININGEGGLFDPADDAAIALAVMEAAQQTKQDGDPASADYARHEAMNWLMTARDRAAKEAAAAAEEAARDKRRDELARELIESAHGPNATVGNYGLAADVVRTAIDRIVDLEQELAKERAK